MSEKKTVSYTIDKTSLVSGAVTLVGALAWNEVAKKFINYVYPVDSTNSQKHILFATLIYAIFVTITLLCVVEVYNVASCGLRKHKLLKGNQKSAKEGLWNKGCCYNDKHNFSNHNNVT